MARARLREMLSRRRDVRVIEQCLKAEPLLEIPKSVYEHWSEGWLDVQPAQALDELSEHGNYPTPVVHFDPWVSFKRSFRALLLAMTRDKLGQCGVFCDAMIDGYPMAVPGVLRRFRKRHWCQNPFHNALKQHYMAAWNEYVHAISPVAELFVRTRR